MLIKKIVLPILCFVGFFSLALIWFKRTGTDSSSLILGTMSSWPPYVSIDDQGNYQGIDIDIAREIALRLNKQLCIRDMDTAALIGSLQAGRVDFIMTGLSITRDRLSTIAMIPYQGEPIIQLPLVFWGAIPPSISSLDDLTKIPGAIVCVEAGSSQEEVMSSYPTITLRQTAPTESLLELKYGRATAALLEPALYELLKKQYPQLTALMIPLDEKNIILGRAAVGQKNGK